MRGCAANASIQSLYPSDSHISSPFCTIQSNRSDGRAAVCIELRRVNFARADGGRAAEPDDRQVVARRPAAFRFPAVRHVTGRARHDQVVARFFFFKQKTAYEI